MEGSTATEMLGGFKSIFNRAKGILESSSPHARNAALLPFLLYIHASESGYLHLLTSDFHSNTWHARFNCDQLIELKETLGFKESFSIFLQGLYNAFASDNVKIELGGPASAIGGKGATSAKIKANTTFLGMPRDVCLTLELSKGRSANDAVGALALDLYEAFFSANCRITELEALLEEEKSKNAKILDAVVQGKANSIHFRPHAIPNESRMVWNETQPSGSSTSIQPSIAPSANSHLGHSLPSPVQPQLGAYSLHPTASVAKHLRHSTSRRRRIAGSCDSSLKLSLQNSYARVTKQIEKKDDSIVTADVRGDCVAIPLKTCNSTSCIPESETVPEIVVSMSEKNKYRDIDTNILAKIEAGGENRSLKTDLWARYDERRAVKYKNKTSFRDIKCCREKDVVDCFDKYFMSLPAKPLEGEPRRLFLAPIKRPTSNVWFRHQNIGARTLLKWYKQLCCPECHPEMHIANFSSGQQPVSLRRTSCQRAGDNSESNGTNLNISSVDRSGAGQIIMAEKHSTDFEQSVEISSDSDEDGVSSKDDKVIELNVLDSHVETNSKDLTNSASPEIDEISL